MSVLREKFNEHGFVVLPHFLSLEQVRKLATELERFMTTIVPKMASDAVFYEDKNRKETLKQIQQMQRHDSYFQALMFDSIFMELAKELLAQPVRGINLQWFNKPPQGGKPTPPHQDGYYFKITPNHALTMWLALDEADAENGCVRYLPESHLKPIRPHAKTAILGFSQGITDYTKEEQASEFYRSVAPGDLLIHHSLMIHRADGNQSKRSRKALGFIYYGQDAKIDTKQAEAYQQALTKEWQVQGKI